MRIYYGWYVVAISILTLALSIGGSIQAFGLFVVPVSESFHLTRAQVNTGAILLNVGMAVAGPLIGRLLDRQSAKMITAVSAVLFGGSLVALGFSNDVLVSSFVILVPLAAAAVGCGTVTSPALVARWFTVHRGRAMAIAMLGIAVGPIVVGPIVGLLIEGWGWRDALIIEGVASGVLLMILAMLISDRPGASDHEPGATGEDISVAEQQGAISEPMSIGQILRLPQFWTIAIGLALTYGILQVIIVSLVPVGTSVGLSLTQGASLISMYGISAIIGSLLVAWLGDRFDRVVLLAVLIGLFTVAGTTPILASSYTALLASAAFIGIIGGAITPIFLALLADLFGPASFGTVNGLASFISTILSALYIRVAGEIFDRTGQYELMFLSFLVVGAIATIMTFATGPLSRRYSPIEFRSFAADRRQPT